MRIFIAALLFTAVGHTQVSAQTIGTIPNLTYPEHGTFCGFLTLCDGADKGSEERS